jgi:hypothetical protein
MTRLSPARLALMLTPALALIACVRHDPLLIARNLPQQDAGGGSDALSAETGEAGDAAGNSTGGLAPRPLNVSIGYDLLVDAFPAPTGIIVIRRGHIELVSRDGAQLALITTPRDLTAATFDGTRLAAVDRAMVTFYDAGLTPLGAAPLEESCASAATIGGAVICPPTDSQQPLFWSYGNVAAVAPIRSTLPVGYRADGPVVAVPGRNQLLALSYQTELYGVNDGALSALSQSPTGTTGPVAFDRDPADRMVLPTGAVSKIATFTPDGDLVPHAPGEVFIAMAGDGNGHIQLLREAQDSVQPCRSGCSFQSIDVDTRTVMRSKDVRLLVSGVVSARHDDAIDGMVLAYHAGDGERVDLLDFSSRAQPPGPLGPDATAGPAAVPLPEDSPLSGCVPAGPLMQTPTPILAAFPVTGGAIVVRSDGPLLLDRTGATRAEAPRGTPVQAAAYDTGRLVVADEGGLAVYDDGLQLLREVAVPGGCEAVTIASQGRALCQTHTEPTNSFMTMSTWSIETGTMLASVDLDPSLPALSSLRRVPNNDAAIGVGSVLSLYLLDAGGNPRFVNTSLLDEYFDGIFAFYGDGLPGSTPVHVVLPSGSMLNVFGSGCLTIPGPSATGCFLKDGELGTVRGSQSVLALADDGGGQLYALTASGDAAFPIACDGGCRVQHIDAASRRVVSSRTYAMPFYYAVSAAFDSECGMLLLTYTVGYSSLAVYHVDLLDVGSP